ncbi:hypothetical protein BDV93DRAFT_609989 [Ceratobasidium sp. AG-I]|nr:hypothetical protein BDV93DRAFT_609989 [Ceratobasidium sp. AG-I]
MPTTVSTYTRPPTIPNTLASIIIRNVVSRCPNLQVLSIFPGFTDDEPEDDALFTFLSLSEPPFHQHLANATHLRELVGNSQMLGAEALQVISRLPQLVRLVIHSPRVVLPENSTPLPDDSFPALRELALHLTCNLGVQDFWRLGALSRLTSLEIDLEEHHHDEDDDEADAWAHDFICFICENSPALDDLKLNFNVHNTTGDFIRNLGNRPMLEALSELPLRTVSITAAWFGPYDADLYGYIPTAFPKVIDLHMPGQPVASRELIHFAKIPHLRHLILNINLNNLAHSSHTRITPVALLLHTLESSVNTGLGGDLIATAQQLLLLWPNLQRVVWPHAKMSIPGKQTCRCIGQSLNGWISMVREITKLKRHISQKYGREESAFLDHLPVAEYSHTC